MNISELARRLRVNVQELKDKLPELGIDIGQKAIKVDDTLAQRITRAWREYQDRERQKRDYLRLTEKVEKTLSSGDKKVEIPPVLTVRDFAEILDLPVSAIIAQLIKNGVMASMNQRIDFDTAAIIATDLGFEAQAINSQAKVEVDKAKKVVEILASEKAENMRTRPPVIVVMGHVDHGKTRLLDAIRKTDVMSGEAGGITQHIGAYQVAIQPKSESPSRAQSEALERGIPPLAGRDDFAKYRKITFIDTPGHEAFTAMRSRGAKVADIAILVVAATEGVMPQTVEAIKIAQEAQIPIIVAVNKIDLPEANPDKVKQELTQYNLLPEEWGGTTIFTPISAKFNKNIDGLLDQVLLLADMNEDKLKANPTGEFIGSVIESHVDPGEGATATVLVQNGALRVGDYIVVDGVLYGKIRVLKNYLGQTLKEAPPGTPAKILGLKVAPKVGDLLEVTENPRQAQKVKAYKMQQDETFIKKTSAEEKPEGQTEIVKLNIILRTDVLGSQEAIIESFKKIETETIKIEISSHALGNITENDVLTAEATGALIFGFNVLAPPAALDLAKDKKVEIKIYKIIYELLDEVKKKLKERIKPEIVRQNLGKLKVLAVFKKTGDSEVVGGKITDGRIEANALAAVLRNDEFVTSGKISELQINKIKVKDAVKGSECGIKFNGQPLIEVGDIVDVYRENEIYRGLS
ncbi:translation initiation factor IF-2 [Candidatus Falkowbacteria bacterium]|nr:translation initiation factor IF-2 [Candidatus Falkowbacteria bacterium]